MFGRSWVLAIVLAASCMPLNVRGGTEWTAGVCTSCGDLADLHYACCDTGGVCHACCRCETRWSTSADFVWMGRSHSDPQPLVNADIGGTLFSVLDARDLVFSVGGGVQGSVRRTFASGRQVEMSYFGVFDQPATQTVAVPPATPGLISVTYLLFGATGGADTSYRADYESDLHNGELNFHLCCRRGFVPLIGVRWLQLGEQLEVSEANAPANGALGNIKNNLVGAQFGLKKDLPIWCDNVRLSTVAKLGVFGNSVDLYGNEHTGGAITSSLNRSFTNTSAIGELDVMIVWQPCPLLAVRAGYRGLWISDAAVLGDQLDNFDLATGLGSLQLGAVNYHGGHLGLELSW